MILYGHWRSLATYRVRVALNLKGIKAQVREVNLLTKEHLEPAYRAINPQGLLPALDDGKGQVLFQSLAIIEYLNDIQPAPPLLPSDSRARARVRALAQVIAADAHPLIVPRVRDYLERQLGLDEAARMNWIKTFALPALETIELNLAAEPSAGAFCVGDSPTMADILLASHVIGVSFFKLDLKAFPLVRGVYAVCSALPAFAEAYPLRQPGAPASL